MVSVLGLVGPPLSTGNGTRLVSTIQAPRTYFRRRQIHISDVGTHALLWNSKWLSRLPGSEPIDHGTSIELRFTCVHLFECHGRIRASFQVVKHLLGETVLRKSRTMADETVMDTLFWTDSGNNSRHRGLRGHGLSTNRACRRAAWSL
jgi:hypothetical protein